jgi:1-phosphofructokinase family hexose kinase
MAGIATLTLNAALDRTLHVERIERGGKSRILREFVQAGGKGVNVARVLRALDVRTRALVVVGGATGAAIARDLAAAGIPADCIEAPGESRTCLEIVEPGGRATQLHGVGVDGGGDVASAAARAVAALPGDFSWLAICGSLPPGMAPDALAALLGQARGRGLRVAIDTGGAALARAWAAAPDLVRINRTELAGVLPEGSEEGRPGSSLGAATRVVVSRGDAPFEAWSEETGTLRISPPRVEALNAIGCGDAMLAGMLAALERGADFAAALRWGTALGAAEACSPRAGGADPALARTLAPRVEIAPQAGA